MPDLLYRDRGVFRIFHIVFVDLAVWDCVFGNAFLGEMVLQKISEKASVVDAGIGDDIDDRISDHLLCG